MLDASFDFMTLYWIGGLVFLAVVLIMAFRFQSGYLRSLARQAEALERIAASLEKRV